MFKKLYIAMLLVVCVSPAWATTPSDSVFPDPDCPAAPELSNDESIFWLGSTMLTGCASVYMLSFDQPQKYVTCSTMQVRSYSEDFTTAYTMSVGGQSKQSPLFGGDKVIQHQDIGLTLPLNGHSEVKIQSVVYAQDIIYLKIKCWTHETAI